jgi:hypothetical protein
LLVERKLTTVYKKRKNTLHANQSINMQSAFLYSTYFSSNKETIVSTYCSRELGSSITIFDCYFVFWHKIEKLLIFWLTFGNLTFIIQTKIQTIVQTTVCLLNNYGQIFSARLTKASRKIISLTSFCNCGLLFDGLLHCCSHFVVYCFTYCTHSSIRIYYNTMYP